MESAENTPEMVYKPMRKAYYIDVANLPVKDVERFWALLENRKAQYSLKQIVYEWNFTAKPHQFIQFTEEESAL